MRPDRQVDDNEEEGGNGENRMSSLRRRSRANWNHYTDVPYDMLTSQTSTFSATVDRLETVNSINRSHVSFENKPSHYVQKNQRKTFQLLVISVSYLTAHWQRQSGGAEIDGPDDGQSKLRGMKLAHLTLTDQNAWVENDGPDIGGPSIAGVDIDGPQLKQ